MSWHQWVGRLLGLADVQAIESIEPALAAPWAHRWPAIVAGLCAAAIVGATVFYARCQPTGRRRTRAVLSVLRAAALVLLVLILAEPVLTVTLTSKPKPLLWVLFDGTDSMAIADELPAGEDARLRKAVGLDAATSNAAAASGKLTRADYVRAWVNRSDDNVLAQLAEKFRLKAFIFDHADGVRGLDWQWSDGQRPGLEQTAADLSTAGQVTAIGQALDDLAARHAAGNLAGVVVVSDFDQNTGPPPAARARALGVPVYAVGVGPADALDLAVDLQAPPLMKKAERSTIVVGLKQTGLDGQTASVVVTARPRGTAGDADGAGSILVGQRQVELAGPAASVEFPFTPELTGQFEFAAEVAPLAGESIDDNNRATREVNVRDDFLRLLFVEYEPTWEWRFVKEVFHRDKLVGMRGFRTFLRSSDPKVRKSNELFVPTLTPQRSEFFAYDVIFLGDLPAEAYSPRFCEMVREFVGTFGGGLVVMAGPRFGPGQLADTALADMLPVVVDPQARAQNRREFRLQLSPAAEQFDFMNLGQDAAEHRRAWDNLGPLAWYQPVARVRSDVATVLAQHPSDICADGKSPQPLLAIRRFGKGEVIYLAFNETWRLRRQFGELYYRQFWGQMIHRLGLSHALGSQKRFVVRTDRPTYQVDDQVIVTAEAYDADFQPLADDQLADRQLAGEVVRPERAGETRESEPIRLSQVREGVYEARLTAAEAGAYRLLLKDPITEDTTEIGFPVTSRSVERRSAVRNVALQQEIAQASLGRTYDLESAARLPEEIETRTRTETTVKVVPLADTWLAFVVVVTLLLGEWLGRKLINLP